MISIRSIWSFSIQSLSISSLLMALFMMSMASNVNGELVSKSFHDPILNFLQKNGKKFLTFMTLDTENIEVSEEVKKFLQKSKLNKNLRSRVVAAEDIEKYHSFHQDTIVLVASSKSMKWNKYLELIVATKIMSSVVICIGAQQRERFEEINFALQENSRNAFFYWIGIGGSKLGMMDWKQILSVKNSMQTLSNELKFDRHGRIVKKQDMQGLHINCSTLSWAPYFELEECKGKNKNCRGSGYLADMINIFGRRFNFTWSCDAEPEGNWGGSRPIIGPRNASGSFGGVFGLIANGTYPLCISSWAYFDWRQGLVDFVSKGHDTNFLVAYFPTPPTMDLTLFFRPFELAAWFAFGALLLVILALTFAARRFQNKIRENFPGQSQQTSLRMIATVGWVFMLITINGYFDGALTMFFADEGGIEFESQRDILNAFPDWTLIMRKTHLSHMIGLAEEDELYKEYTAQIEKDPKKFFVKNVKEGIERMKEGQSALKISDNYLRQYYKNNPLETRPNTIYVSKVSEYMILTENSPLLPIFNTGSRELYEMGIVKFLEDKWIGKNLEPKVTDPLHTVVLSFGQMIAIFIGLGTAIAISIIILGLENLMNWITNFDHI